jgi:outer membrane protein assembly factor BamB
MNDRPPRAVRRVWLPVTAGVLAAAAVAGASYYPDYDVFPNDARSMAMSISIMLAILVVAIWVLFLSGMRWISRIAIVAVAAGLVFGTMRWPQFQGNLSPIFRFRWQHADRTAPGSAEQVPIPEPTPADYPEYRNRNRDGVVTGLKLDPGWAIHPPKKLWELSLGEDAGYGGIAVVGPSAVTIEQIGPNEAVVCYDADTGKERWKYEYEALFSEAMGGNGPRTTPTIADGDVYAYGATGHLVRLDGKTGKPKWAVETLAGRNVVYWGASGSPLVYDRFVVVNPGRNRAGLSKESEPGTGPAVVAYDRETGKVAWESGDRQAGYSSPQLATISGTRQILVFDGVGLGSLDPETGKEFWFFEWAPADPDVNVAQPLVFDDGRVFISSGYGKGCTMLTVSKTKDGWGVKELWSNNRLKSKFANPVRRGEAIYGIDESAGSLVCLDAANGKVNWKEGRFGNGQVLLVGDFILLESETGKLVMVEANPEKWNEVASFQALRGNKNWNYLTAARGRAYVRNHEMMACYELPVAK